MSDYIWLWQPNGKLELLITEMFWYILKGKNMLIQDCFNPVSGKSGMTSSAGLLSLQITALCSNVD